MAIKVSAKTVAQLRKGTMAGNLAKAKNASPEMREALVRFYGAKRVNAAGGTTSKSVKTPSAKQTGGMTGAKPKAAPSSATRMDKPKAKATGASTAKSKSSFAPSGSKSTPVERGYEKVYTKVTSQGSKPLVDVPKKLGGAQSKLNAKAAANKTLLADQKKKAQANAKKNGMK